MSEDGECDDAGKQASRGIDETRDYCIPRRCQVQGSQCASLFVSIFEGVKSMDNYTQQAWPIQAQIIDKF